MRLSLLLPLAAAASPALADTLPLARGAYVERGDACADAPNAVIRRYDGQGIGSSKVGRCTGRVLVHIRRRYTLRQNCEQYGDPRGRRFRATDNVKVRVDGRTSFTDLKTGTHYRLCPGLHPASRS
ncbi:hypothetical protein [Sphingomonas rubra]|uniref:Uncharacterized protein n=1 Tax=Sphingomonas rubra TaxID=634430 RepID=A0A1I5PXS3_9SPHN|nr:hypothetical protein [Sphingomonas rubra]SFP38580.1 hypothetical protein SAMN04488241_101294 [Sphingomonas rubra]